MMASDLHNTCSFCGKHKDSVKKLIVGEKVGICNECVDFCQGLLIDETPQTTTEPVAPRQLDPVVLKEYLDQYVIGQDSAKVMLSVAIVNHYKRINKTTNEPELEKPMYSCLVLQGQARHYWPRVWLVILTYLLLLLMLLVSPKQAM